MTLSRTPLRASKEHEVELTDTSGTWGQYRCTRCGDSRSELIPKVESGERDPLPWPCTGLKRSGLQRNKRVNPVSERREEKRAHQRDEGLRDYVRDLPCRVKRSGSARCEGPVDAAHVRNWGAGYGDWVTIPRDGEAVRVGNLVPLCRKHHRLSENEIGSGHETFQRRYQIDLQEEAEYVGESYQQEEAG